MKPLKKTFNKKSIKKFNKKITKLIIGNELILGFSAGFTIMSILTLTMF